MPQTTSPHETFLQARTQKFGDDSCFLCGAEIPVGSSERTREHVFPKWLLHALDLWDGSVNQIDGRALRYRNLTVPCCTKCNGVNLSAIEGRVRAAFDLGLPAFEALDRRDLFIWLGKIYYGLVYKESLQPRSVRERTGERLVPSEHLKSIEFHHFLLQASAGLVDWDPSSPGPASFHFFECLDNEEALRRFDYLDDLFLPMIGIRIGPIGVVCVLQDWGRSEGVRQPQVDTARTFPLHPTQFREAYSRIAYMSESSWTNLDHLVVGREGVAHVMTPDPGDFDGTFEWSAFAPRVASAWQVPVDAIYDGVNGMSTIGGGGSPAIQVPNMDVVFVAAFDRIGLWPSNTAPVEDLPDLAQ